MAAGPARRRNSLKTNDLQTKCIKSEKKSCGFGRFC